MSFKEGVDAIRQVFAERLRNPLIGSFIIALAMYNWRALAHLFLGKSYTVTQRIKDVESVVTWNHFFYPALFAIGYTIAMPWLAWMIDLVQSVPIARRKNLRVDQDGLLLDKRLQNARKEEELGVYAKREGEIASRLIESEKAFGERERKVASREMGVGVAEKQNASAAKALKSKQNDLAETEGRLRKLEAQNNRIVIDYKNANEDLDYRRRKLRDEVDGIIAVIEKIPDTRKRMEMISAVESLGVAGEATHESRVNPMEIPGNPGDERKDLPPS